MEKSFIMRLDSVGCEHDGIKAKGLTFGIKDGGVTGIFSAYPSVIAGLVSGEILPFSGIIILAGVNVTERNLNERRVAKMPDELFSHSTDELLKSVLDTKNTADNVLEIRERELKDKLKVLKAKLKCERDNQSELKEQIRKTQVDITALGFRMKRRQTELELNLKAARGLLESVKKTSPEYVPALRSKLFSAQFELCAYMHKAMPYDMVESRIREMKERFGDARNMSDTSLKFMCAYSKAPVLIVCADDDGIDAAELRELCAAHKVSVCCAVRKDSDAAFDYRVDIPDARFNRK